MLMLLLGKTFIAVGLLVVRVVPGRRSTDRAHVPIGYLASPEKQKEWGKKERPFVHANRRKEGKRNTYIKRES
jgi:hypothetical protein